MIENHSDDIKNSDKSLEDNLQGDNSDSIDKNNINSGENLEVNSETNSKEVDENSNDSEDTLNTCLLYTSPSPRD